MRHAPIIALLSMLALLPACQRTPDEQIIRQHIEAMAKAVETRDNGEFLSHVADTYTDHEGHDRRTLRQLLLVQFAQHAKITVSISDLSIELHDKTADVTLRAQLTGGGPGLDARNTTLVLQLKWKKQGRDWVIYRARWERQG